jgi:phosphoenolpyruvate carboxylase
VAFVREVSGSSNLLWYRPWLGTSVMLRSAMIHPLNLIQILNRGPKANQRLVRETATGIASGMMTTG